MDLEEVETPIMIQSYTTQRWLCKLEYEYKDIYKDVFIHRHEQSDIIED